LPGVSRKPRAYALAESRYAASVIFGMTGHHRLKGDISWHTTRSRIRSTDNRKASSKRANRSTEILSTDKSNASNLDRSRAKRNRSERADKADARASLAKRGAH